MPIQSAGYILHNNEAIWAIAPTAEEAWDRFRKACEAGTWIIERGDEQSIDEDKLYSYPGPVVWQRDYRALPATAALMQEVEDYGGDMVRWGTVKGVACTVAEEEAA